MFKRTIAAVALCALMYTAPTYAADVSICGSVSDIKTALAAHEEKIVAIWQELEGDQRILFGRWVEAYLNGDLYATWTLVMVPPHGNACTLRDGTQLWVRGHGPSDVMP